MQKFDMGNAWKHSMELLRLYGWKVAGFTVLAYVGLFVFVLGGAAIFAGTAAAGLDFDSGAAFERLAAAGFMLVFIFFVIFSVFVFASYYASWRLSLSGGRENFAGSLLYGIIASIPAMLVTLLVFAAFGLLAVLLAIPFGLSMDGMRGGYGGASSVIFTLLLFVVYGLLALFLVARLGMCGPIMTVHKSYNPFFGFAESWKMTRGNTGMLMLYVFIVNLVLIVVFAVISAIVEAVASMASLESILTLPVNIAFTVIYTLVPAGMYNSMAGGREFSQQDVESIFE